MSYSLYCCNVDWLDLILRMMLSKVSADSRDSVFRWSAMMRAVFSGDSDSVREASCWKYSFCSFGVQFEL